MNRLVRTLVPLFLLAVVWTPAQADWTASGTFQYVNREFDASGFTGVETPLTIRAADVEVVDANAGGKKAVLATGVTDNQGAYSIFVSDSKTRDVYVRVVTRSDNTADLDIGVRNSSSGKPQYYASATATVAGHSSSVNVDFGVHVAPIGQGGEAFNIYDTMLQGADYIAFLTGSRPASALASVWGLNNGVAGSSYSISLEMVLLRDTAGYDDTVILHEMGHFVVQEYSATSSFGGSHTFSECEQDLRLSFEEGFVTYWGNSARRHQGLPISNIYTRTNGGPAGPGSLVRFADLETDSQYLCEGSRNEVNVSSVMWDISDGASTPDTTPGVDDAHDLLDLPDSEVWEVMTDVIPGNSNLTLENFWDGWFLAPIQNGFLSEMIAIADHLEIEYSEDNLEVNDTAAQATSILPNGSATHATFFRDPEMDGAGAVDEDFFSFSAVGNQAYVMETQNLKSGGNTYLRLLDTDGQSLLAFNDNRGSGDDSSLVNWTAPRSDLFYIEVSHAADIDDYGSYDLVLTVDTPTDNDSDGYDSTTDCNDDDPDINPGATEICDGVDQDCDGQVDNGFDVDSDGYTTCGGDCDDSDPNVNPGMEEVPANGIDDNCNGEIDEQPSTDVVTITRADWKKGPKKLIVEATSDQQPNVTLTVVGFGVMTYDAANTIYKFTSPRNTANPGSVTVDSSGGGSDSAPVN